MLGMALFAGREIAARQERPLAGWWSYGLGAVWITTASMLVTIFALTVSLERILGTTRAMPCRCWA